MLKRYRNFYMIYCIGSGFAALMIVLNSTTNVIAVIVEMTLDYKSGSNISFLIMYIFAMTISIYGIFCGVKIANNSPNAKKYLRIYSIPQIPLVSIPGFIYFFKLGLDFTVYLILDAAVSTVQETRVNFSIGSFFNLNFNTEITEGSVFVGLNIIPIILLISLLDTKKLRHRQKRQKKTV